MVLRSDEEANQAEIGRDERFRSNVGKGVATAVSLGGAALSSPIVSKILPFLNQYIPAGLAMKGINKISPKLGSFLKQGQDMGLNVEDGLTFLKDKIEKGKDVVTDDLIEKYSPELSGFIENLMDKGETPETAAAVVRNIPKNFSKFKTAIEKIEKHAGQDFSSIVNKIYAKLMKGKQPQQLQQGQERGMPSQMQQPQQQAKSQQPQQGQQGNGYAKQQLMQAMQSLSQQLRS